MNIFVKTLVTILGLSAYIPMIWNILQNKIRSSFCTWILWTALNVVVLISLISQGAPYLIAVVYTIGTLFIALLVLIKKQFTWEITDTIVTLLIAVSILVLIFGNPYIATITGSIASFLAGIPEIIKIIKNPKNASRMTALLFIGANVLVIVFTKEKSFINIVYPGVWALYWFFIITLSLRKVRS